jgi:hypothetical protein
MQRTLARRFHENSVGETFEWYTQRKGVATEFFADDD